MPPRPVPLAFLAVALLIVALWGLNFPVQMAAGGVTPTAWAFVPLVLNGHTATASRTFTLTYTRTPTPTATGTATATSTITPTPTTSHTPTATATGACPAVTPPASGTWLAWVNYYRRTACLALLTENTTWSSGGVLHSRYLVKNNTITHSEDPGNPWYTTEGNAAGENGNVAVNSSVSASDRSAIDLWMAGPFHAVGIVDPELNVTGFGSYRENVPTLWKMGATLDVLRGLGSVPPGTTFPIRWPAHNMAVYLTAYGGTEFPDPLTGCSGYTAPTGLPILLQIGSGALTPVVSASSFMRGPTVLEHCTFTEATYTNPNNSYQSLGRSVLNARDAVVLIPRAPLSVGQSYTVSLTVNGQTYTWTFHVVSAPAGLLSVPAGLSR